MPKVGQEPIRKAALVSATIHEIGKARSLDVTVGQIARKAGMSTALAHYYFDSKSALFIAAMRHVLSEFGRTVRTGLRRASGPQERLRAIVVASLGSDQFEEHVVAAWLVFYVEAQRAPEAARLLRIYTRRLHSNLMHELLQLTTPDRAQEISQGTAAMIDGLYIRHALGAEFRGDHEAGQLVTDYLDVMLQAGGPSRQGAT